MAKKKNDQEQLLWYSYNMAEEKDFKAAVKNVQKICRGSLEYDMWQTRTKSGSSSCPVCSEYYDYIKAETHHYPATMYDVTERVLEKHVFENTIDDMTGFAICQEVMNNHFLGNVEFVVLCKSCHEKFHAHHPEIVKLVAEIYQAQKDGKPIEGQKPPPVGIPVNIKAEKSEILDEESKLSDLPPPPPPPPPAPVLDFPTMPKIIDTGNGIMVIVKDGIEIDL